MRGQKTGALILSSLRSNRYFLALSIAFAGCSLTVTRPTQDMSDTAAAIQAAREVGADIRTPELFQQAEEWFGRSKREYKFKNFRDARDFALKAREFAEQAEFLSVSGGASRKDLMAPPPEAAPPAPGEAAPTSENELPEPSTREKGVFVESLPELKKQEAQRNAAPPPTPTEDEGPFRKYPPPPQ